MCVDRGVRYGMAIWARVAGPREEKSCSEFVAVEWRLCQLMAQRRVAPPCLPAASVSESILIGSGPILHQQLLHDHDTNSACGVGQVIMLWMTCDQN